MEIVREIMEILFKVAVIIYMIMISRTYSNILEHISALQKISISQAQYTDILKKKLEKTEEEIKNKTKRKK